ncbi:hypothetical protein [Acidocella aminolytica]|uniref:Uncharacterized protein n=1 Tax=Acidocella aminolytica 101 = DSM 11237 TaxID=1120923 RepID=A0A0D6PEY8_9PROT|nr:hypothetical protein [Acidocella aminolytica]GAN80315.1 hypothetical protein Aam_044_018 [Acidocella aminolytica 101 = DSM 11237]GBQ33366.1 hypothetical protein AA11237_0420 [Acidocella aminolytica 101 = DSM 11237]SHF49253.1 hypothetical protein SAMN02746095_03449 [Acidocella aminolytica 101 = DSM 11237]
MSFTLCNLLVLAYANGFTLWHYKAGNDNLVDAVNPWYFTDAADLMTEGDMVMLSAAEGVALPALPGGGRGLNCARWSSDVAEQGQSPMAAVL